MSAATGKHTAAVVLAPGASRPPAVAVDGLAETPALREFPFAVPQGELTVQTLAALEPAVVGLPRSVVTIAILRHATAVRLAEDL